MHERLETLTLTNGVQLICQPRTQTRAVAFGVWLENGCRDEADAQQGYAHLLEHLFFKGIPGVDAAGINRLIDRWGGNVNAHTGREMTALHGMVPAANFAELAGLLLAMLTQPGFDDDAVRAERQVVLQELAGVEDAADEYAEQRLIELSWPDHPMGREILGRAETLASADAATMQAYRECLLQGARITVVAAGAVSMADLYRVCRPLEALPSGARPRRATPAFHAVDVTERRDTLQSQLLWAMPLHGMELGALMVSAVANQLLGGGVSSRLFQRIREELGLCYDIRSWLDLYADTGLCLIQTACEPEQSDRCRAEVDKVLAAMAESVDETLLAEARDHLSAGLQLAEDNLEGVCERLAREYVYFGLHPSLDERLAHLGSVTAPQVRARFGELAGDVGRLRVLPTERR